MNADTYISPEIEKEVRKALIKSMAYELEIIAVLNKIHKDGKERESYIANPKKAIDKYEADRKRDLYRQMKGMIK